MWPCCRTGDEGGSSTDLRGKRTSDKAQAHGSYSYRVSDPYDRRTPRRDSGLSARPVPGVPRQVPRSITLIPLPRDCRAGRPQVPMSRLPRRAEIRPETPRTRHGGSGPVSQGAAGTMVPQPDRLAGRALGGQIHSRRDCERFGSGSPTTRSTPVGPSASHHADPAQASRRCGSISPPGFVDGERPPPWLRRRGSRPLPR